MAPDDCMTQNNHEYIRKNMFLQSWFQVCIESRLWVNCSEICPCLAGPNQGGSVGCPSVTWVEHESLSATTIWT